MATRRVIKPFLILIALALFVFFVLKLLLPATSWGAAKLGAKLGIKTISVESGAAGLKLNVRVTAPAECVNGDFYLIQREMSITPRARLILTLEPILPGAEGVTTQYRELSLGEIVAGVDHDFELPPADSGPHDLGVYLCLDQTRENSCAGKEIENVTELLIHYVHGGGQTVSIVKDKPYFFQYVRSAGRQVSFTQNLSDQIDSGDLRGFVRGRDLLEYGKHREAAARISELYQKLGPLPLVESAQSLAIILPRMDSTVCETLFRNYQEQQQAVAPSP